MMLRYLYELAISVKQGGGGNFVKVLHGFTDSSSLSILSVKLGQNLFMRKTLQWSK